MWSFGQNYWSVDNNFPNLTFKYGEQVISERASERIERQTDTTASRTDSWTMHNFSFCVTEKTKITQVSQL